MKIDRKIELVLFCRDISNSTQISIIFHELFQQLFIPHQTNYLGVLFIHNASEPNAG